jgi:uncharacterized protein YgbK (DUF1537 family)
MSVFFGAIADDFTGATDLAAMLARAGVAVNLRIGLPGAEDAGDLAPFEVIALKSRTLPREEAVSQARAALAWLRKAGAERIFWKYCSTFDSTPQGNIGPVAEALMTDLGVGQTIYCPAFPENGRTVYNGYLHVGDQLLNESPMKDHPLTPMRDASLVRLLKPQVRREVGALHLPTVRSGPDAVIAGLLRLAEAGVAHVVLDAVAAEDLHTIAAAVHLRPLLTGGSAVVQSLPELYAASGALSRPAHPVTPPKVAPGSIVLSGSCSAMTRVQVGAYLDQAIGYRLDPLELATEGVAPVRRWLATQDIEAPKIIYATAEPATVAAAQEKLGVARAGVLVEDALAQLAVDARSLGAGRIVVAGGETSGAVTRKLGVDRLAIGPEIAPGVPWTFCTSEGRDIALTLKSGNFGSPNFFAEALALLENV